MAYKLFPPFEIYHNGIEISDRDGHICTAENREIAKAIVMALEIANEEMAPFDPALASAIGQSDD